MDSDDIIKILLAALFTLVAVLGATVVALLKNSGQRQQQQEAPKATGTVARVDPPPRSEASAAAALAVERTESSGAPTAGEIVRQATLDAGKATGEALLEHAKEIPMLAPVAFLVGAVASSAATAVNLKQDCAEFGKVVTTLEAILIRAENLESHGAVIDEVRESLEEALQLMQKMADTGFFTSVFFAKRDAERFEDIKTRIEQAIARLNLRASVDVAAIATAEFRQSRELQRKVDEMGGPEAVATDPERQRQVLDHLKASDAVVLASVAEARKELRAIGDDVGRTNESITRLEDAQRRSILETSMANEANSEKLEQVINNFANLHQQRYGARGLRAAILRELLAARDTPAGAPDAGPSAPRTSSELQRLQNEVLKRQVDELKSMLGDVKDAMQKFPVPAREPERMLVINDGAFLQLNERDASFAALNGICKETTAKFDAPSFFNFIGGLKQYIATGYMPASMLPEGAVESVPNVQEMAVNICGIDTPRKVSVCQHVIAKAEPVVFEGLNNHPAPAPVEDLAAAARVDPELASFLTALQASTGFEKRPTDTDDELKNKIVLDFFTKVMSSPESAFYCGVPVRVQGQVVASFCMLAAAKPAAWNDADVSFMEAQAARAAVALERQLSERRMKQAQEAMMRQMFAQQQQMMQQMGGFGAAAVAPM